MKAAETHLNSLMKTALICAILAFLLVSCTSQKNTTSATHEIEIGEYVFQFPKDFQLIKERGVDSHVGKVSNGKIEFNFDYGYYSNKLDKSIEDYFSSESCKWNALGANGLLSNGDVTGFINKVNLCNYQTIDSVHYTFYYLCGQDTIAHDVVLPEKYRSTIIEKDTVENAVYKWVNASDYIGLYAYDMGAFNKSIRSYLALLITSKNVSPKERQLGMKILRTCKLKK